MALLGPSYKKFLKFKDQGLFGSLNTSGTIDRVVAVVGLCMLLARSYLNDFEVAPTEELRPWRPKFMLCNNRSRLLAVHLFSSNPSGSYLSQRYCKQRHNETARNL